MLTSFLYPLGRCCVCLVFGLNLKIKKKRKLISFLSYLIWFQIFVLLGTHTEKRNKFPWNPPDVSGPAAGGRDVVQTLVRRTFQHVSFFFLFFLKIHIAAAAAAVYRVCVCVLIQLITYPFLSGPLYTHTSCLVASSIDWMCVFTAYTDKEQSRKRTRVETFRRNVFIDRNKLENEKTHTENIFIGATNFSI
jgi:hypothetical protein